MDSGPNVLAGRLEPEPVGRFWQAVAIGATNEPRGSALGHRRDRERRVHPEARWDRGGVHAEEALVVEHLAAIVDHPEAGTVRHPAAAQRMRAVDARRLRELQELADATVLGDPLDRLVGLIP